VFLTAEALYMWMSNGARRHDIHDPEYKDDIVTFSLKKDDELFVEWLGSEYVYDDKTDTTFTLKTVKITSVKALKRSWIPAFIDNVESWVSDDILFLSDFPNCKGHFRTTKISDGEVDPVMDAIGQVFDPEMPTTDPSTDSVAKNE